MHPPLHRRDFLGLAAGAAAAGMAWPGRAHTEEKARKDIRIGVIGPGPRGRHLARLALGHPDVQIVAVCDILPGAAKRLGDSVQQARGKRPEIYSRGPEDYLRVLERDDVDAVMVTTPMRLHAPMSIAALRAGKHVFSEVAAAVTLQECFDLVRAVEETGKTYMMGENCCYYRNGMMVGEMVRQGVFGSLTYAECGYIHDCRRLWFEADGSLTWRGAMHRDLAGNLYPTHAIGPVARWLGINRTDRFVSLTASSSRPEAATDYAVRRFGKDHPAAKIPWKCGDSTNALIRTARGALIEIRYDTVSTRPHPSTTHFLLQGTRAAYLHDGERVYVQGRTPKYAWEPIAPYQKEFDHAMWKASADAAHGSGHGGVDYFTMRAFLDCLRTGARPPVDVYDAVLWSSVTPLSGASVEAGGASQDFPDFMKNAPGEKPV